MYAKGWHGSTAAPERSCSGMCYGHGPTGLAYFWGGSFSVLAPVRFYNTDLQKELKISLVAIEFRIGKTLETVKFHCAKAIFCTLIWKLCLDVYECVIASIFFWGQSLVNGRGQEQSVERKTKHNFSWQLLTGSCQNSLQLLGSAFLIYSF